MGNQKKFTEIMSRFFYKNLHYFIATFLVIIVIILLAIFYKSQDDFSTLPQDPIIPKTVKVKIIDVKEHIKPKDQEFRKNYEKSFKKEDTKLMNYKTLSYFQALDSMFPDSKTLEEHFAQIEKYLLLVMDKDNARKLLEIYKTYFQTEIKLVENLKTIPQPNNANSTLEYLRKIQIFRREQLGEELANELYGAEIKGKEYLIRKGEIINNRNLYGEEKEKHLQEIKSDMWGNEQDEFPDKNNWEQFLEKQLLYQRDLAEIKSEDEKNAKINEFRKEFFTPTEISKLEEVDDLLRTEKENKDSYLTEEKKVKDNSSLNPEQKKEEIHKLQNEFFKDQADAYRRSETMQQELDKQVKELDKTSKKN